jgi:hypothetical protein
LNHNGNASVIGCLHSIFKLPPSVAGAAMGVSADLEILVVDNSSTDQSANRIAEAHLPNPERTVLSQSSSRPIKVKVPTIMRCPIVAGLLLCFASPASCAEQVVFLRDVGESPINEQRLALASRFYGVPLHTITLQQGRDAGPAITWVAKKDTLGTVITTAALRRLHRSRISSALRRSGGNNIPLLILGVTPELDAGQLADWSDGALSACQPLTLLASAPTYVFGPANEVTRQLAGEQVPGSTFASCGFVVTADQRVDPLLFVRQGEHYDPVFVRTPADDTFYAADMRPGLHQPAGLSLLEVFSQIAPAMMFVHHAAGERAWHSVGHYANLSIDDAWLIEPYGHLNYEALLGEMERHNFHTTIAFIPWNYDRSRSNVVALFRRYNDRLSVCIHGNNHNHAEFATYPIVPLEKQVANIQQAVARMQRFKELTRIYYDRVMIFPHGTGPENTLAELKKYNFLATAYSLDLPLGAVRPSDPLFYLRSFSLHFANFPGINRYFAGGPVSRSELAINAFVDNPLLFYGHENLFNDGIQSFNNVADAVNSTQPDTRWCSLGCVAQHLYLVKLREDGNFDAELFSNDVILENRDRQGKFFFVTKAESFIPPIKSLTANGQPLSFRREGDYLSFSVFVPSGQSRNLRVEYANDWNVSSTDISKKGVRIALLRRISDFRDLTLSRYSWGRTLTRSYYDGGFDRAELKIETGLPALVLLIVFAAVIVVVRSGRRRTRGARTNSVAQNPVIGDKILLK